MLEVSFGEWLKRQRSGRGMTQEQLAQEIGCAAITLRKIEAEERRPSAQIVERLSVIFDIPQKEQTAFLHFARGDVRSAPTSEVANVPWRNSQLHIRSNIPTRLTQLIGREREIHQVRQYLANASTRLVTLTGPPGIGKTSLGQQVAKESIDGFLNGVFFIALASLEDPKLVASTISQTLRFEGRGKSSDIELLKDGIADKQMLLVLDNFEHLLKAAVLVPELLIACPNLKILVTSREALRVPGEWLYPVPPLVIPQVSPSMELDISEVQVFSALTLFAERARAVHSDFELNPGNANIIAAICARLDGLPLAIELIAARIRLMSPQELLSRMDDRFTLYADGMRAIPARQKTVHNSIAWSYDLLSRDEQIFFAQLGVFAGSFTLEAAVQVTGNTDALRNITTLLDKSLLQRIVGGQEQTRFTMLFTIREFALNRLAEMNETAKLRAQHLKYFLNLAEQADKEIHGPRQIEWLDHLEAEHGNYRAALAWSISSGQTESALNLIGKLCWLWLVRNFFSEARAWFDKVRVSPDIIDFPLAYAMALNGMSRIVWHQDEYVTARSLAEESQRICQSLGKEGELGLAGALSALGMSVFWGDADVSRAEACFEQALALYQAYGARWEWALSLFRLGFVARRHKDYERSRLFFEESLAIFHELEDAFGLGRAYVELGRLFFNQGDYTEARKVFEQALIIDRQLRYQFGVSVVLLDLGKLSRVQGDYDQAEVLFEESLSNLRDYNFGDDNISPFYLGCIMLYRGNYSGAKTCFIEFITINLRLGIHLQVGEGLVGLAAVAAGLKQYKRAALLAGAGRAVHDAIAWVMYPEDLIEIDPLLQSAREQLGDTKFEALVLEGRAMTTEKAIAYALEQID